jgi:predicted nucleic acid-binding protein
VSAERQNRIKTGESPILFLDVLRFAPTIQSSDPLLVRAMEIALFAKEAIYDCLYLALTETESCELLTADDLFAKRLRAVFPFIISLSMLP